MLTNGIDFSHINQMGSYLFLTRGSSGIVIMSRLLRAISGTCLVLCVDKRVCLFL